MKKTILLLVMISFLASVAEASCCCEGRRLYAKFFSGPNFLQDTENDGNQAQYDTGYVVAGSLGYRWCYGLRVEGEYAFRKNDIEHMNFVQQGSSSQGHVETSSYMANLLWDVPLYSFGCHCWGIQPFVGAGIGYDSQRMHASNSRVIFDQKWQHFSWQLMAGVAYPIFCHTDVTLEYQFHQGGSQFCNHAIGVGLEYRFGCPR